MRDFGDQRSTTWNQNQPAAESSPDPGKRTLTEMLPSVSAPELPPQASAPVQRKADSSVPATTSRPRPTIEDLFGVQRKAASAEPESATVHASAQRGIATAASPLPHAETIQRAFGRHDVSRIQAHTGPEAATSAGAMGAKAYATGDHVVLGEGSDLHTVAHEAAHVVQQRGGVQLKGGVGAVGDPYERQADEVADLVVRGESAEHVLNAADSGRSAGGGAVSGAVQRVSINPATEFGAPREHDDVKADITANQLQGFSTKVNGAGWHTKVTFDPLVSPGAQAGVQLNDEGSGVTGIVGPDHAYGSRPSSPTAAQNNTAAAGLRGGTPHVAAHILNDQLGGPGVAQNLFAFPGTANTLMESQVESKMKAAVQAGHYIYYRGVVNHPAQGPADKITMSWNKLDHDGNDIGGGQSGVEITAGNTAVNQAVVAQAAGTAAATRTLMNPSSEAQVKAMPWGPFQMPDPKNSVAMEPYLDISEFPAVGTKAAFQAFLTEHRERESLVREMLVTTLGSNTLFTVIARWIESVSQIEIKARRGVTKELLNELKTGSTSKRGDALFKILATGDGVKVIPFAAGEFAKAARTTARSRV